MKTDWCKLLFTNHQEIFIVFTVRLIRTLLRWSNTCTTGLFSATRPTSVNENYQFQVWKNLKSKFILAPLWPEVRRADGLTVWTVVCLSSVNVYLTSVVSVRFKSDFDETWYEWCEARGTKLWSGIWIFAYIMLIKLKRPQKPPELFKPIGCSYRKCNRFSGPQTLDIINRTIVKPFHDKYNNTVIITLNRRIHNNKTLNI